jgi:hypothetical protein
MMENQLKRLGLIIPIVLMSPPLLADTTIQLNVNSVFIRLLGVDDHIKCTLNGRLVASQDFGEEEIKVDIGSKLRKGINRLVCTVTDDDGGSCYGYSYQVWSSLDGQPAGLAHSSGSGCCGQESCVRPGNPVLRETVWINKP